MRTLLCNGWVYKTGGRFEKGALLVNDTHFEAVFNDRRPAPDDMPRVDLGGKYIIPGFVDTHLHLTTLALKATRCDLSRVRSRDELVDVLKAYARGSDRGYVMGVEWDEDNWDDRAFPTRDLLDSVDDKRPVLARRICGHTGVVNTVLLKQLGDHPPALVDRANGVLREHALWEVNRLCDPPPEDLTRGMEQAIGGLHRLGITAIHDIVEPTRFDPYVAGVQASRVPLHIDILLHTDPASFPSFQKRLDASGAENIRLAGIKCFLDGSFGGNTAALNAPYLDHEGTGTLLMTDDAIEHIARFCYENNVMCAMHAIGDRAIDQALGVIGAFPKDAACFRIEHCELIGPSQLEAIKNTPALLALQPNFVRNWAHHADLYEQRLGKERLEFCNPYRTLTRANIPYVFGSDGMPPGPLYGIKGATEHPVEAQRLPAGVAIDYYTDRPNRFGLQVRQAGRLEPGMRADYAVLDADPLTTDLDTIGVTQTAVGGRVVYDRLEAA